MSELVEQAFDEESGPSEITVVFDFLYHDPQRVGSFLAQFDPDGHLQSLKRSENVGTSRTAKSGMQGRAGVPGLRASLTGDQMVAEQEGEVGERVYDPLWANARSLLDYVADSPGLVAQNLSVAIIGQFVLITGALTILDMTIVKSMFESETISRFIRNTLEPETVPEKPPAGPRQAKHAARASQPPSEADIVMGFMPILPHLTQAILNSSAGSAWCSIQPERLSLPTGDLAMKHGPFIAGEWTMLGVLDAYPDDESTSEPSIAGVSELFGGIATMMAAMRPVLGRPPSAYGLTPLLIYREVRGPTPPTNEEHEALVAKYGG